MTGGQANKHGERDKTQPQTVKSTKTKNTGYKTQDRDHPGSDLIPHLSVIVNRLQAFHASQLLPSRVDKLMMTDGKQRNENDGQKAMQSWLQTGRIRMRSTVNILTSTAETEAN